MMTLHYHVTALLFEYQQLTLAFALHHWVSAWLSW